MSRREVTSGWHGLTRAPKKTFIRSFRVTRMRQAVAALAKTTAWLATHAFNIYSTINGRIARSTGLVIRRQTVPPVCLKGVAS